MLCFIHKVRMCWKLSRTRVDRSTKNESENQDGRHSHCKAICQLLQGITLQFAYKHTLATCPQIEVVSTICTAILMRHK